MERRRAALTATALLAAGSLTGCAGEPAWFTASVLRDAGVELVLLESTGAQNVGFTDMARYGTLLYDGRCWRLRADDGAEPAGVYAVGWADSTLGVSADPATLTPRPDLDVDPVAAGDYVLYGGGQIPVERVDGYPEECQQGTDGIVMINDARIPPA
ncbi:hypothetical protein [Zhihengliuella flava]|uniref:Lipoprotein n=1 Tax=Zhihengliuella flava TaxID=1285193 RepID=A0A931DCT0_9MICC|nr:hypothetical protein [Zhihengliuella flava]MBG6084488.1 hypothetical protein [Zhihengliuella flava]